MKKACIAAVLASMIAALPVHADDLPGTRQVNIESRLAETERTTGTELGIDFFTQDTHGASPVTSGQIQAVSSSVLGLQMTYLYYVSALYYMAQVGYGLGGKRLESGPPFAGKDELKMKMFLASIGLGYTSPLARNIFLNTTLQLMYQNSIATLKYAGTSEEDGPGYNSIGMAVALGTAYQFARQWKFRAELYSLYSYGFVSKDEAKLIEWVKFNCYRVGLSHSF